MNVDFSGRCEKLLFWETGNLSPRNLEFYSSFRAILGKFRESWNTPVTAMAGQRESAGPAKVKTAAGVPTKCPGLL